MFLDVGYVDLGFNLRICGTLSALKLCYSLSQQLFDEH